MVAALWAACLLSLGGSPVHVHASGETTIQGTQQMPTKPKPAARQATFDSAQLVALLPASLGDWTLKTMERPMPSPMPQPLPALRAEYVLGAQTAVVALITYMPAPAGNGAPAIHHQRRDDRQENTATLALRNGLTIVASSHGADGPALAKLISAIDLARAEKLVRLRK